MVLVTVGHILASPLARGRQLTASGVQIVQAGAMSWSNKPVFVRKNSIRAVFPSDRQIAVQQNFASIASGARGSHGIDPASGLPPAAALVQARMGGGRARAPRRDELGY